LTCKGTGHLAFILINFSIDEIGNPRLRVIKGPRGVTTKGKTVGSPSAMAAATEA
jgi:hypothetical protein